MLCYGISKFFWKDFHVLTFSNLHFIMRTFLLPVSFYYDNIKPWNRLSPLYVTSAAWLCLVFDKWNCYILMGFTYPIPDRWRMCTISYSISRWRTAISCGQCRSSNMIYYAEIHRQTFEKLTWLKGTYYTETPSIRFMFVTFQYYCICWMSKLPRLKRKHH